jgi:Zn-finger nucleic acid-binding protein
MPCTQCGANIALSTSKSVTCKFCGTVNQPSPKEVPVPVPVNVVHNVVQVVGDGAAPRELRCPHCRKRLVGAEVDAVTLYGCSGCGGIWIDNTSAKQVLQNPLATFTVLAQRAAANAKGGVRQPRPVCATCPAILDKVRVHGIELDICGDHGTWFDALELSRLTAVLRGETAKGQAGLEIPRTASCVSCRAELDANRLNITDSGPTCDTCWRSRQSTMIARADSAHDAASAAVLIGVAGAMLGLAAAAARARD